ncbi:hypothetical protein AA0113_g3008 [Alternaria arborescens]|uniref:Uncharacterized protein n=1 Tax=Alternaria arborescens TaxID=156630 RepID=A0A4Q4SJ25_9PLEO|nr:hypothetical protein AA0112_g3702 [Alternaria arborescens]RYO70665.1 hypothetical protein AA0113_g3008 [Alternaria arborescens]
MSQISTPLSRSAVDPFSPSLNQDQQLSQADFEELFGTAGSAQPVFSSNDSDIFDELGFTYEEDCIVPGDPPNPSAISTPNFSDYDFGLNAPVYPTPGPNSPHPYPLELQPVHPAIIDQQDYNHRPRPTRSQTNNAYNYPAQTPQCYGHRRRSLSTSDANRIAASNSINNPTFIRLQAPRARSGTPEDRRRNGLYYRHGRSASQGPAQGDRPTNPTSTPYHIYSDSLVGGLLPTPIGTPLNQLADVEELNYRAGTTIHTIHSEGPVFRHMRRPEKMARSRRIIEIGALVVSNRSKLDPRLEPPSPTADRARILEKLGDIEEHLRNKEGKEALPACMTIRVTLSRNMDAEDVDVDVADNTVGVCSEAPGKERMETRCDTYNDHDDNEIMEMLMRENGIDGQDEVNGKTK